MADGDSSAILSVGETFQLVSSSDGSNDGSAGSQHAEGGDQNGSPQAISRPLSKIRHSHSFTAMPSQDKRQHFKDSKSSRSLNSSPNQDRQDVPPSTRRSGRKLVRRPTELPPPPPDRSSLIRRATSNESVMQQSKCRSEKHVDSRPTELPPPPPPPTTKSGSQIEQAACDVVDESVNPQPEPSSVEHSDSRPTQLPPLPPTKRGSQIDPIACDATIESANEQPKPSSVQDVDSRPSNLPCSAPNSNRGSLIEIGTSDIGNDSANEQPESSPEKHGESAVNSDHQSNVPPSCVQNEKLNDEDVSSSRPKSAKPRPAARLNMRTSSSLKTGLLSSKPPPPPKPKDRKKPSLPPKPGRSSSKTASVVVPSIAETRSSESAKKTSARNDIGNAEPESNLIDTGKRQADSPSHTSDCNGHIPVKTHSDDPQANKPSHSVAPQRKTSIPLRARRLKDDDGSGDEASSLSASQGVVGPADSGQSAAKDQCRPEDRDKDNTTLDPPAGSLTLQTGSQQDHGEIIDNVVDQEDQDQESNSVTAASTTNVPMDPVLSELRTRLKPARAAPPRPHAKPRTAPRQSACFTTEDLDLCAKPRHQVANSPSLKHVSRPSVEGNDEEPHMQLKRMRSKSLGLNVYPPAHPPPAKPKVPTKPKLNSKLTSGSGLSSAGSSDSETDTKLRNRTSRKPYPRPSSRTSKAHTEGRVRASGALSVVNITIDKGADGSRHSKASSMRGSLVSQTSTTVWHTEEDPHSTPVDISTDQRTKQAKGTGVKKRLKSKSDLDRKSKDESVTAKKLSKGTLFYVSEDTELNKELMFGSSKFYGSDRLSDEGKDDGMDKSTDVTVGDKNSIAVSDSRLSTAEPTDKVPGETPHEPEVYENVPRNSQIYESIEIKKNEAGRLDLMDKSPSEEKSTDLQSSEEKAASCSQTLALSIGDKTVDSQSDVVRREKKKPARSSDSWSSDSSVPHIYDNSSKQLTPEAIADDIRMTKDEIYEPVGDLDLANRGSGMDLYENVLYLADSYEPNPVTVVESTHSSIDEDPYHSADETSMMNESDFASFSDTESEGDVEEECQRIEAKQVECTPPKDKLHNIAEELYKTEVSYVKKLHLVDQIFQRDVIMENRSTRMFPDDVIPQMFSNIKSIYQFHNDFLLPQLAERMQKWEEIHKIGDLMKKFAPFLKLYSEYVKNFDHSLNVINSWMIKSPAFAGIVEKIQKMPECEHLTLQHHMLGPIQRVPRYELLLKEYIRHLPDDSDDREDSLKALELVSTAALHSDEAMKKMEKFRSLLELSESFGGTLDVISPTRELIKKGKITKVSARNGYMHERHLLLFNDMLVLCQSIPIGIRATFRLKARLDLDGMQVIEGDNLALANTFVVKSKQKSIELHCATQEEKVEWQVALWNVIADHTKKQLSRNVEKTEITEAFQEQALGVRAPTWVKDQETSMCMNCGKEFSTFKRRHHCRACGIVVCGKCSKNQAALAYDGNKLGRVCDKCYKKLSRTTFTVQQGQLSRAQQHARTVKRKGVLGVKASDVSVINSYLQMSQDRKTWHRRWFAVHEDFVMYSFKAHQDVVAMTSLPLPGFRVQLVARSSRLERDHVFRLWHPNQKNYFFQADSAAQMKKWTQVLEKVVRADLPEDYTPAKNRNNEFDA